MEKILIWLAGIWLGFISSSCYALSFPLPPEGQDVVGSPVEITSRYEDTFSDFARDYDLGYREMLAANPGVDPWLPGAGTRIVIPTQFILPPPPRKGLIINLAELRLYYFPAGENRVITHPIGIGREGWETPTGKTRITQKTKDPTWTPPASVRAEYAEKGIELPKVVKAGPDNPLGRFALRLGMPGYLIHGTDKPYGVGMRVSHGCIRLYPEDIKALFPLISVKTPVRIINQPYKAGWLNNKLYLEVHPPLEEDAKKPDMALNLTPVVKVVAAARGEIPTLLDWEKIQQIARQQRGVPVAVAEKKSMPELVTENDIKKGLEIMPPSP
ncbi:MAG TPA: L,D-transpeptidase [Gammaproteobacteria bacterium]|nr:L,D-transpeptidase [Gammaproteobacteria bacterium]